jgi:hypothetical protein
MSTNTAQPDEVTLIGDVKHCNSCKWFWGGIPPYGPYPAFDWKDEYPEAIKNHPKPTMSGRPIKWTKATSCGDQLVEPAVLRGCRKAPIMTVGINPNLTAYYASPKGAGWAYPRFKRDSTYAYYYRHATIFQESLTPKFIEEHIQSGTEIRAAANGWLLDAQRGADHRWVELTLSYEGEVDKHYIEMSWKPGERAVVLVNRAHNTDGNPDFRAGDLIAGKLVTPTEQPVEIQANGVGYYQRLIPVLERVAEKIGTGALLMGEDVCMHDMVGCASPGWSSAYDIPVETISRHCVNKHDYVLRQLIQSRPEILIVVSTSSLYLFAKSLEDAGGSFDFEYRNRDVYDLLRETTVRKHFLTLQRDGQTLHTRVMVTPHFSYSDNFSPHSRFQKDAWEAFKSEFPNDAKILEDDGLVKKETWNGYIPLNISGPADPISKRLGTTAWSIVMARFFDAYTLMTNALLGACADGELVLRDDGRLDRSEGACQFCNNDLWQFPKGCPYEKC